MFAISEIHCGPQSMLASRYWVTLTGLRWKQVGTSQPGSIKIVRLGEAYFCAMPEVEHLAEHLICSQSPQRSISLHCEV